MRRFRIGIDNYGLSPMKLDPMQTLRWAKDHGADGVHFSGLAPDTRLDESYLRDLAAWAAESGLYLEWGGAQHIPRDMSTWAAKEILASNRNAAKQAQILGTRIVRSCSGGLMRWQPDSPMTETLLDETSRELRMQKQMWLDHGTILAIETHFEFTSFELVSLLNRCEAAPGEWLGICFDSMNCLTLLEDPVRAARRLAPWIVCTHCKDGGMALSTEGLTSFPVPIGRGIVDFPALMQMLDSLAADITLSVEDHAGSFPLPVFDAGFLSKFPDLSAVEFSRLVQLCQITAEKSTSGCTPIDRSEWPAVCEARMAADLASLQSIAAVVSGQAGLVP
jgi:sugar phosphate isomerase/epimerase